jgi:hypothetical protein
MAPKKDSKTAKSKASGAVDGAADGAHITTPAELKTFLTAVLDKLKEDPTSSMYGVSAMRFALNLPEIYKLLDNENREIARDIWLRVKSSGYQVKNPPLLFPEENP